MVQRLEAKHQNPYPRLLRIHFVEHFLLARVKSESIRAAKRNEELSGKITFLVSYNRETGKATITKAEASNDASSAVQNIARKLGGQLLMECQKNNNIDLNHEISFELKNGNG